MGWRPLGGGGLSATPHTGSGGSLDALLASLGVDVPVRHAVSSVVRGTPTPVQSAALPAAVGGDDLLAVAPTGSGKSLLFAVALAHRLSGAPSRPGSPRALVFAPTRELAEQDAEVLATVAAGAGLRVACFVGGGPVARDRRAAVAPLDVVVATPGRLLDLLRAGVLAAGEVSTVVLDEADQLLAGSFATQTTAVLDACRAPGLLAVTATADEACESALRARWPALLVHRVGSAPPSGGTPAGPSAADSPADAPSAGPPGRVVLVTADDPVTAAAELAVRCTRALFFVGRRDLVSGLRDAVAARGVPVAGVDGSASPTRRREAFDALASGSVRVLVSTDLSGRGLDLDRIGHVVHVGVPHSADDLVHRSGRTGRGRAAAGVVVAVVTPGDAGRLSALAGGAGLEVVDLAVTGTGTGGGSAADALIGPVVTVPARPRRRPAPADRTRRPATSRPHRPKRKRT